MSKRTRDTMSVEKVLIIHRETNKISCFCGYFGTSHKCKVEADTVIKTELCSWSCKTCTKIEEKERYDDHRFKTNLDGYLVCGVCEDKISTICEYCFCQECWEENHDGEECKTKKKYS